MKHVEETTSDLRNRILLATALVVTAVVVGASGYHVIGDEKWSWGDCFYMTIITLSTVGYAETLSGMAHVAGARIWTVVLIVLGSGTLVYFVSSLIALIVEGDLNGAIRRRRMKKNIGELSDHIIVCGVGSTGIHVVSELISTGTRFVAVEANEAQIEKAQELFGENSFLYVLGDATHDEALIEAGIARAKGVVAALHDDKENLFVTISARSLNSKARIIAKAVEHASDAKMRRAGADSVVSPNFIGGMRMVSEMVRPRVVEFLDQMLRDREKNLRVDEVLVPEKSPVAGKMLGDLSINDFVDSLVIAVRMPDGEIIHNPKPNQPLPGGTTLILIGRAKDTHLLSDRMITGDLLK